MNDEMILKKIESFLEERIGLSPEAIGPESIIKAVLRRKKECGRMGSSQYYDYLVSSEKECEALVETVVVPETWFFRNRESFAFLNRYVLVEWMQYHKDVLRILSVPCSTGEEPYSIAITLLENGVPEDRFQIDAVDISREAISKAEEGIYGRNSFRGMDTAFKDRYFETIVTRDGIPGYRIQPSVVEKVRFIRGNLMDDQLLSAEKPYDVIFFRNLLIYFSAAAKRRSVDIIERLLVENGILFVGHAERTIVNGGGFVWTNRPGVFACRKTGDSGLMDESPLRNDFRDLSIRPPRHPEVRTPFFHPMTPTIISVETLSAGRPEKPVAEKMLDRAHELADQGDLKAARSLCEKCLADNAFDVRAHFLMGLICQAEKREEDAEIHFNRTVYLDPNHHEALSHLAFIMEKRGFTEKAERYRRRAWRIRLLKKGDEDNDES